MALFTANVGLSKSYVELFTAYVRLSKSHVGLIIPYVGLIISYGHVGLTCISCYVGLF